MWLMPIAALVEALITINVMLSIGFIPPLVVFLVVLLAIAVLGFARPGPRVFLVGGIVLLLFVGLNLPFAVEGLIDPIGTSHAWTDIISIVVGVTGGIAGIAAFVELRRGRPAARARAAGSAMLLAILVVGLLVGTSYVSVRGYSALEGTPGLGVANGVVTAPAQAPVELDAIGTAFSQKTLQLRAGPGTVYVVNADSGPHTFDIELNGRILSYPVPGRSTTAVVLDLAGGGFVHVLVRHSRSSVEHGRNARGDPVTAQGLGAQPDRAAPCTGQPGIGFGCQSSIFVPSGSRRCANRPFGSSGRTFTSTPCAAQLARMPSRSSTARLIMKSRVDGSKYVDSASNALNTVAAPGWPAIASGLNTTPPQSSSSRPITSRYQALSARGSLDLKNTPPIPRTLAI